MGYIEEITSKVTSRWPILSRRVKRQYNRRLYIRYSRPSIFLVFRHKMIRKDLPDVIREEEHEKFNAVASEVEECHKRGRKRSCWNDINLKVTELRVCKQPPEGEKDASSISKCEGARKRGIYHRTGRKRTRRDGVLTLAVIETAINAWR